MKCETCKELYKLRDNEPYYRYWCKFFKYWILMDKDENPIPCNECKELNE